MDSIQKFLLKLSKKEQRIILDILQNIYENKLEGLDIKKLKNTEGRYRVRKGKIRIIYNTENGIGKIISIDYRSSIYNKLS